METIYDIMARAEALKNETRLNSISPERVGSILEDTLKFINEYQLLASALVICKVYTSVSAMQSDAAPVSDLTGRDLVKGQLVVISPDSASDTTSGDVYRYDGIIDGVSQWTYVSKIGDNALLIKELNELKEAVSKKQDTLVSGHNIKTVNNQSLLGSGNLTIREGTGSGNESGGSGGEGGGGNIDPSLLEGYMPMMREFSDDFNDDFTR